ncbi:hypothetical protein [Saccharothrix hoggarensis]|uniref:Small CPxCG-related zinc finger protein n=1 Tax=Saccharothrix hoggarensis TaxID=913853 RepID=A0ABW3QIB4_9PSEU
MFADDGGAVAEHGVLVRVITRSGGLREVCPTECPFCRAVLAAGDVQYSWHPGRQQRLYHCELCGRGWVPASESLVRETESGELVPVDPPT